jgi:hypothetical protein
MRVALAVLFAGACCSSVAAFTATPLGLRSMAPTRASSAESRFARRPGGAGILMQQTTAPPAKPYAEVLSAIKGKVTPKWDDGAYAIFETMEKLKEEGYLTRWNSAALKSRPVNQGELKRQLKTDKNLDELLGLIGEVQDADLKQLTFVGVCLRRPCMPDWVEGSSLTLVGLANSLRLECRDRRRRLHHRWRDRWRSLLGHIPRRWHSFGELSQGLRESEAAARSAGDADSPAAHCGRPCTGTVSASTSTGPAETARAHVLRSRAIFSVDTVGWCAGAHCHRIGGPGHHRRDDC